MKLLINIVLPLILLVLQFSLKYFIDRKATVFNFVISILEVPLSIIFLGLSFFAAYVMTSETNIDQGFIWFLVTLFLAIISIFIWRRSVHQFENERFISATLLGILNLFISVPILVYSIMTLIVTQ